jgi:O-acetyl-ADP-ribose deacetylase (regulator of RNase III)
MKIKIEKCVLFLIQGDITTQDIDIIVNPANASLMGGGGVDGAIHRRGGPKILEECKKIRESDWPQGLPTGKAVITTGGNLKSRFVIHTVGPIWNGGKNEESEFLADAYQNSLKLAISNKLRKIAFPSISTGAFGYPIEEASQVALRTIKKFIEEEDSLDEIRIVLFSSSDKKKYEEVAMKIFTN